MLATEIGKMQAETTGRTTETKPLIAIPSSMGADSEPHPPMPGIGLEMKCTQDVMGLCACPKPDCAPIGNKNVSCCYFCDFLKIPLLKPQHQCFSMKRNYSFIMIALISTTNSMNFQYANCCSSTKILSISSLINPFSLFQSMSNTQMSSNTRLKLSTLMLCFQPN